MHNLIPVIQERLAHTSTVPMVRLLALDTAPMRRPVQQTIPQIQVRALRTGFGRSAKFVAERPGKGL